MVTAKKVILSTQGQASQAVFGEIIVNAVSAIQMYPLTVLCFSSLITGTVVSSTWM